METRFFFAVRVIEGFGVFHAIQDAITRLSWWKKQPRPFVFIIGFNKTATRSLHHLFAENGYSCVHWDDGKLVLRMLHNLVSGKKILTGYDTKFQVYSDLTFVNHSIDIQANTFFRIMDRDYPGSYFIYNTRGMEDWIKSRAGHAKHRDQNSYLSRSMSLNNTSDPEVVFANWREQRHRFETDIRSYFANADNFVELDVKQDDVCRTLSDLLHVELDAKHWTHIGKGRAV